MCPSEFSDGVSADGLGNVYISGSTFGDLAGTNAGWSYLNDAFVSKYDEAGNLVWTQQLGTSESDQSHGVSADGLGNVYISGWTGEPLVAIYPSDRDAFVAKIVVPEPELGAFLGASALLLAAGMRPRRSC